MVSGKAAAVYFNMLKLKVCKRQILQLFKEWDSDFVDTVVVVVSWVSVVTLVLAE